jgi:Zn finger protein HypA/HybF involved in hydrogenase expression
MIMPVKVKCRKCGRDTKSDEFILDPVYKMMVCRECVKERKLVEAAEKKTAVQAERTKQREAEKKQMPAGWDYEDAEIERAYSQKIGNKPVIERIDDDRVKYTCKKCKYAFTYFISQHRPARCPYCATSVQLN